MAVRTDPRIPPYPPLARRWARAVRLHRTGLPSEEISRRLRIPLDSLKRFLVQPLVQHPELMSGSREE